MNWRARAREKAYAEAMAAGGPVAACWLRGLSRGEDAILASKAMKTTTGRVHRLRDDEAPPPPPPPPPPVERPKKPMSPARARAIAQARVRWVNSAPHINPGCFLSG